MTDRVTYQTVTVTNTNVAGSTFDVLTGDGTTVQGIVSNAQNLPSVGQSVTIWLQGATVLYQPEGIAAASVGDTQISAVGGSKLTSDTVTANLTLASQILTATSGQRAGINSIGLQAWDASNNLTVSLTGVTNLLTGTTQTAVNGRRVVFGAGGDTSQVVFYGADGTEGKINSFAVGSVESLRVATPIEDTFEGWNAATFQSDERATLNSGRIDVAYGGNTAAINQRFTINEATTSGSPGSAPSLTERFRVDPSRVRMHAPDIDTQHEITNATHRFWVGTTAADGSVDIIPHGLVDANTRSPRIQLRGEGGTQAGNLKFVIAGGVNRIECTNTADAYGEFRCLNLVQTSTERLKTGIVDAPSAIGIARAARGRQFSHVSPAGKFRADDGTMIDIPEQIGPTVLGLVAEEAPPEIRSGDGEGIDVGTTAIASLLGVKELDARIAAFETRLAALERGRP